MNRHDVLANNTQIIQQIRYSTIKINHKYSSLFHICIIYRALIIICKQ